jgi:hypothetical protein
MPPLEFTGLGVDAFRRGMAGDDSVLAIQRSPGTRNESNSLFSGGS